MKKILLALAGALLALGIAVGTSVPAQAVTMSRVQYCNWPMKASVQTYNHTGSIRLDAYSPSGSKLGSYYGNGYVMWHMPWEDVIVWAYSADGSYGLSGHCRY